MENFTSDEEMTTTLTNSTVKTEEPEKTQHFLPDNKIVNRHKIKYTGTRIKYSPTRIKSRNFLSNIYLQE